MAIYNLEVKTGLKGNGLRHAQYIERDDTYLPVDSVTDESTERHDEYIIRQNKYAHKSDLIETRSGNMPKWAEKADDFWAAADKYERENGRTYRELEVSLPRELTEEQHIELIERLVKNTVGNRHAYTWAYHCPMAADGEKNPHVHFMFTERENDGIERSKEQFFRRYNPKYPEIGGAKKNRFFNSRLFIHAIRKEWAATANYYMEELGLHIRIDERSYKEREINLVSQHWQKQFFSNTETQKSYDFATSERLSEIRRINGQRIIENPEIALKVLTSKQSYFTKKELEKFIFTHTDSEQQYLEAYNAVLMSEQLQQTAKDGFYTSFEMYATEVELLNCIARANKTIVAKNRDLEETRKQVIAKRTFNPEQETAFKVLTSDSVVSSVNGAAGTGKSYVLGAVNEVYQQNGYAVYGVALQSKTADNMQQDIGVKSSTISRFLMGIENGNIRLDHKSVIILDEAGMVGSRDMLALLSAVESNHAKIRMVGDSFQLTAVSAGNAFAKVQEHLSNDYQASLSQIMRQKSAEMREASIALSKHDVKSGMDIYWNLDKFNRYEMQQSAARHLVADWYQTEKSLSKVMLAYTNKDVAKLNQQARTLLRDDGTLLGKDYTAFVKHGERTATIDLAVGDKIIFRENNRELGVFNGSIGTVSFLSGYNNEAEQITVTLDSGRVIEFGLNDYNSIQHGYASTIHSSQGITVDNAYLLASRNMNANLAYVGMTRHRQDLQIYYSAEEFEGGYHEMVNTLSKGQQKEFVGDKSLIEDVEAAKISQLINRRETLADKAGANLKFENAIDRQLSELLSVEKSKPYDRLATTQALPTLVDLYRTSQREQGQHIQSYKLGSISIAAGDYLTLQQDFELKTGLFKKLRITAGTEIQVKAVVINDKDNHILATANGQEIKIPTTYRSYTYSARYTAAYNKGGDFTERINAAYIKRTQATLLKSAKEQNAENIREQQNRGMKQRLETEKMQRGLKL